MASFPLRCHPGSPSGRRPYSGARVTTPARASIVTVQAPGPSRPRSPPACGDPVSCATRTGGPTVASPTATESPGEVGRARAGHAAEPGAERPNHQPVVGQRIMVQVKGSEPPVVMLVPFFVKIGEMKRMPLGRLQLMRPEEHPLMPVNRLGGHRFSSKSLALSPAPSLYPPTLGGDTEGADLESAP